ncbi:MAG: hypothetical protein WC712_06320 [Candidatus Brocadiia bacterium]
MAGRRVLFSCGEHRRAAFAHPWPFAGAVLDSGAWSAACGRPRPSIDSYAEFLARSGHLFDWYASYDTIGDPIASTAAFRRLVAQGLSPVPVFHPGEPLSILDEYRACSPIVALGSNPRLSRAERVAQLEDVFTLKPHKYHLFRASDPLLLALHPFSADSSTWARAASCGLVPGPGRSRVHCPDSTAALRARLWVEHFGAMCA